MHKRFLLNKFNENALYISSTIIENGFLTSLHSHANLELLLITKGSGVIKTTNHTIEVKECDFVVINPNCMHCEIGEGLRFYAIGLDNTTIFANENYTKKIILKSLNHELYKSIKHSFDLIYDETRINDKSSASIINSSINIIFSLIERSFEFNTTTYDKNDYELVENIKQIIDSYYQTNINLNDISHRLSLSVSSICHIFKKHTNQTIFEYKLNKQLEEACNLLTITDMKILDICQLIGFNDNSYFSKTFRKKYGFTPKEFRMNLKK